MFIKRRDFLLGSTTFLGSYYLLQKLSGESIAMADSSANKSIGNSEEKNSIFNSTATVYNKENAYFLALVSQLVYRTFEKDEAEKLVVQQQAKTWGYDDVYFFHNDIKVGGNKVDDKRKDSEAIVLINSDSIVVAFRGSETDPEDWKNNAKFRQDDYLGGKVHRGFVKALNDVWLVDPTNPDVGIIGKVREEMKGDKRTLWITGHSLGGAMAILAAAACQSDNLDVSGVYTYGQPRVGDLDFANMFDSRLKEKTFRVVNNNDIVARIPNIKYEHVGTLKFINSSGNISDENLSWFRTIYSRGRGRLQDFGKRGTDGINDHRLNEEYIPKLKSQLQ